MLDCFVDTGDLEALQDCANSARIVIGRTGSGKTALLTKLSEVEERAIWVKPANLALAHVSNSTILRFLTDLGVKLDVFFILLWRHVLTVELVKAHFHLDNERDKVSFVTKIKNHFRDKRHADARLS